MRLIVQRVKKSVLTVDEKVVSSIDKGLLVFIGINNTDTEEHFDYLINKLTNLRIFPDENNKLNLSVKDIDGGIQLVSNFTIYADTSRGRRPDFRNCGSSEHSLPLYDKFVAKLKENHSKTVTGLFGEKMFIDAEIDGPLNIIIEK